MKVQSLYKVTLQHDGGTSTVFILGFDREHVTKRIMSIEGCPRRAVKKVVKFRK